MPKILRLDDNTEIEVAEQPEWCGGIWECGDQRFTDPQRDLYEAIPEAPTREQLKVARDAAVEAIKVTTAAGNTFDGDETSQTRMARAIVAMQATNTPTITWVLADNSVIQASASELTEALALAGAAQAAVWVIA